MFDSLSNNNAIYPQAAEIIRDGGVIAYPTEGVWGLGCDPDNAQAVSKILQIKSRPMQKGLILIGSELEHISLYLKGLRDKDFDAIVQSKGKGISWLIPNNANAKEIVSGGQATLVVRLTDHPVVTEICQAFSGAIVSTSANPSGQSPAISAEQVNNYFGDTLNMIVPGVLGGQNGPSEIRDIQTGKVLREAGA